MCVKISTDLLVDKEIEQKNLCDAKLKKEKMTESTVGAVP
jgi:hypothetical protein